MYEFNYLAVEDWQSSMSRQQLLDRNRIIRRIRNFFEDRGVLEVDTPILSNAAVTDVHLDTFKTKYGKHDLFLNTSPEYHMKRLLACKSGPIFQICKCFRNEPTSRKHNPEFTMLEWYRTGYTLQRLLDEVEDLFHEFFEFEQLERYTYDFSFKKYLGFSALEADYDFLVNQAAQFGLHNPAGLDRDALLEFIFSTRIEPHLGMHNPVAIYNYPASQAALAQITPEDPRTAQRAEVFYKGIELANGFYELTDVVQQENRFKHDLETRKHNGQELINPDLRFLAALHHGLPASSGIALGLDRFIMLALNATSIDQIMPFSVENA